MDSTLIPKIPTKMDMQKPYLNQQNWLLLGSSLFSIHCLCGVSPKMFPQIWLHETLPLTEYSTHHRLYDCALPLGLHVPVSEWLWQRERGNHKYGDHLQPVVSEKNRVLCKIPHWTEMVGQWLHYCPHSHETEVWSMYQSLWCQYIVTEVVDAYMCFLLSIHFFLTSF